MAEGHEATKEAKAAAAQVLREQAEPLFLGIGLEDKALA